MQQQGQKEGGAARLSTRSSQRRCDSAAVTTSESSFGGEGSGVAGTVIKSIRGATVISGPKMFVLKLLPAPPGTSGYRTILFRVSINISPGPMGLSIKTVPGVGQKVVDIRPGSALGWLIRKDDLLTEIDGIPVNSPECLRIGMDSVRTLTYQSEFSEDDRRWGAKADEAKAYFMSAFRELEECEKKKKEELKESKRKSKRKYNSSTKGKESLRKYNASAKGQENRKRNRKRKKQKRRDASAAILVKRDTYLRKMTIAVRNASSPTLLADSPSGAPSNPAALAPSNPAASRHQSITNGATPAPSSGAAEDAKEPAAGDGGEDCPPPCPSTVGDGSARNDADDDGDEEEQGASESSVLLAECAAQDTPHGHASEWPDLPTDDEGGESPPAAPTAGLTTSDGEEVEGDAAPPTAPENDDAADDDTSAKEDNKTATK